MQTHFSHSQKLQLAEATLQLADQHRFEVQGYAFSARREDLRKPRIVRVGAVQNGIVASTTEPVHVQRDALHAKLTAIIKAAAASDVNVLCMQEAWSECGGWVEILQHI